MRLRSSCLMCYDQKRLFNSKQFEEDMTLYKNFKSSLPQLKDNFLITERNKLINSKAAKLVPIEHEELSLHAYFDLQNPLLSKYGIDPAEVLSGAAMAFNIIEPIELNPEHYVDAKYHKEREFLKEVMAPSHFKLCSDTMKICADAGYFKEVSHFKLISERLIGLTTQFANQDKRLKRIDEARVQKEKIYMGDSFKREVKHSVEIQESEQEEDNTHNLLLHQAQQTVLKDLLEYQLRSMLNPPPDHDYPPGSVVALADILFDYQVGIRPYYRPPGTQEKIYIHPKIIEQKSDVIQFQACISGQVPLVWQLAA